MLRRPRRPTLFPYPTLFRSRSHAIGMRVIDRERRKPAQQPEPDVERLSSPSPLVAPELRQDRKSTRLNSSHANISYAVFCLKKKLTAASAWRLPPRAA